jgi:hypothetical protein
MCGNDTPPIYTHNVTCCGAFPARTVFPRVRAFFPRTPFHLSCFLSVAFAQLRSCFAGTVFLVTNKAMIHKKQLYVLNLTGPLALKFHKYFENDFKKFNTKSECINFHIGFSGEMTIQIFKIASKKLT